MATTAQAPSVEALNISSTVDHKHPIVTSIKNQAESPQMKTAIPSQFPTINSDELADPNDPEFSVPVVDYSLLISSSPEQRSKIIDDLANICQDWGFFVLVNHGMPESLRKGTSDAFGRFFQLPEEDKQKLQSKGMFDPVKYGTSYNPANGRVHIWRDYIKIRTYPDFHTLDKPSGINEVCLEYTKRIRELALQLLEAISEGLGLKADYIYKTMNLENGYQHLAANYYPPCPEPESFMGLPAHTDHGLFTFIMDNGIAGLQIHHNRKWVKVDPLPNSFFVSVSDYLQILTNGKYKSVPHRACVNEKEERMTITVPHGPSLDISVGPSPELLEQAGQAPMYKTTTYREYIENQQNPQTFMIPPLVRFRI